MEIQKRKEVGGVVCTCCLKDGVGIYASLSLADLPREFVGGESQNKAVENNNLGISDIELSIPNFRAQQNGNRSEAVSSSNGQEDCQGTF